MRHSCERLTKPAAPAMACLLRTAVKVFTRADYVITDQGGFSGAVFRKTAARLGIVHRFGTVGRIPTASGTPRRHTGRSLPRSRAFVHQGHLDDRGRRDEGPQEPPFTIRFLDPDKRALPILKGA